MVVYNKGFSDYVVITKSMMTSEEKFVLGSLTHLGKVVVQHYTKEGIIPFNFRCMVGGNKRKYYGERTVTAMQIARDAIYNQLLNECGIV